MKYVLAFFFLSFAFIVKAQVLVPGDNVFDKKWIRSGVYDMSYCMMSQNKSLVEIGNFRVQVNTANNQLAVYTTLTLHNSPDQWIDTSISDGNTFRPIYRSSFNNGKEFVLKYGKGVSGYYYDKKLKRRTSVNDPASGSYFDSYAYPYLLGMLPLNVGYRKEIAVYEYKPENQSNQKKSIIEEVKSNIHKSNLTGEHKVWQVTVWEEATRERYVYYVDKETRRLWRMEVFSKDQHFVLIDKETDFNPFKSKFDKETTLRQIKDGNSVIMGQTFARDNQAPIKGIAILNVNKKQFARAGTVVVLIPHTDFFKEWIKLNQASRKKGISIPLPKDAAACIKTTTVYDDEGHFEFTNLLPGEFLLFTEFNYVHTATRSEVVGYTDTYINGIFQGSSANTVSYRVGENATAAIQKIVTIAKDGDKENIKLKKTR